MGAACCRLLQDLSYYSAPKTMEKKASLDEVDPELLATFDKLGIPLAEQKRLTNVAGWFFFLCSSLHLLTVRGVGARWVACHPGKPDIPEHKLLASVADACRYRAGGGKGGWFGSCGWRCSGFMRACSGCLRGGLLWGA